MRAETSAAVRSDAAPWLGPLARAGMAGSGVLYVTVAVLAATVAVDGRGSTTDSQGALRTLAQEQLGSALLVVLAIGFAGYALWRFAVAALGEKLEAAEDLNALKRIWYVARGGFFAYLSGATIAVLTGSRGEDRREEARASAEVLSWPGGRWIVLAAGLGVVAYAAGAGYRGVTRGFEDDLKQGQLSGDSRRWVLRLGTAGYLAKATVFALIGIFLLRTAWQHDPQESKGLDGALAEIAQRPYGNALLGLTAAGLLCWGLFRFAQARYRKV